MQRFLNLSLAAALAASLPAPLAHAHAFLDHAVPGVGLTVSGPVRVLRLYYTQGVVTAFSHVHVVSAAGAQIPVSKPVNDPSDCDCPSRTCAWTWHLLCELASRLGRHPYDHGYVQLHGLLTLITRRGRSANVR
jgi:hypothetical protein